MTHRKVIAPDEIYLESFDPATGEVKRQGRFRVTGPVGTQLTGLFPPVIAINDDGRDTQPFASTATLRDTTSGLGIKYMDATGNQGRFWWSTLDTRYSRQVSLPPLKTARTNAPAGAKVPRQGAMFNNRTYVAFDDTVYAYYDAGSGEAWSAALHSFIAGGTPQSPPVQWNDRLYWFLGVNGITHTDGATWTNIALNAVAGCVVGDVLYVVSTTGDVYKAATHPPLLASFSLVTSVNDFPTGMLVFPNAANENVPYIVGVRTLYVIDPDTGTAQQAGPQFPPGVYGLRADVLSSDNQMYLAQGMSVIAWDGDTARSVGLDNDDGIPVEFVGGVKRLLNGNLSLFALIDSNQISAPVDDAPWSGDPFRDLLTPGLSRTIILSREASGWHFRAVSDAEVTEGTMLFLSAAEGHYRLWFAWNGTPYTVDLETGFFNPLTAPVGAFEASGEIQYPIIDFGYHESKKVALLIQCRTGLCTVTEKVKLYVQYDESGAWYELYNDDGSFGIVTNGRHTFELHATPIPVATSPLQFHDEPGVGFSHDNLQIKATLERGSDSALSPRLEWVAVHVLKSTQPLTGFTLDIDMGDTHHNLTPQQQDDLLRNLILDNSDGLLLLTYNNRVGDFPPQDTRAVKVTGFQARETTGERGRMRKSVRLSLSEVTVPDAS